MFLSEIKDFKDDAFEDKRGTYWTSWKKDKIEGDNSTPKGIFKIGTI